MSDVTSHQSPAPVGATGPGPGRIGVKFRDPAQRTGFVQIENIVLCDRRLTGNDVRLYGVLKRHAISSDIVWPGQDRLAEMACIAESTVREGLNRLVRAGLLGKERRRAIPPSNIYSIELLTTVYTKRALEFEAGEEHTEKRRAFFADPANWLVDPARVSLETSQSTGIQRIGDVSPADVQSAGIPRFEAPESGGTNRRDSSGKKMNSEGDETEGGTTRRRRVARPAVPGENERGPGESRESKTGSGLTKKTSDADQPPPRVPGSQYEKPAGYDLSKPATGGGPDDDDDDEADEAFTPANQPNQPSYPPPPIENLGPRTNAVKPKSEPPTPKQPRPDDEGTQVFNLWRDEMRDAYPDFIAHQPSNPERGMGKVLWDKYVTRDPDGKANVENLRKIIRVAVWDWNAATDHEAFQWIAKPGTQPRFDAVVRAASDFVGFVGCGILTRSHRMSRYFQRFLAKVEIPQSPAAVDPITEIARREGKGIAVIHREILAGLRPDPRQASTDGQSATAG